MHSIVKSVPFERSLKPGTNTIVAVLSRTFHSVRCSGDRRGVSVRHEYFVNKPGGYKKSSAQPPFGHHPSYGRPVKMAASNSAARSTPVCPPDRIRRPRMLLFSLAICDPSSKLGNGPPHRRNLPDDTLQRPPMGNRCSITCLILSTYGERFARWPLPALRFLLWTPIPH